MYNKNPSKEYFLFKGLTFYLFNLNLDVEKFKEEYKKKRNKKNRRKSEGKWKRDLNSINYFLYITSNSKNRIVFIEF